MNVRDLHEKIRESFSCIDGLPRNYMEIPVQQDDGALFRARFVYQTIGVTMRGEVDQVEPILCGWLLQRLCGAFLREILEDRSMLIIFRRWPQIVGYVDGDGYEATKLTMRLVIPGEDLRRIFGEAVIEEGQMVFRL